MRITTASSTLGAVAALALITVTACQKEAATEASSPPDPLAASQAAGPVVLAATGAGNGVYSFVQGTGWRTFAFNARRYADGTVDGQIQVHNQAADNGLHGRVVCMGEVGNGILGIGAHVTTYGTFTEGNIPNLTGDYALFAVRDNGEGSGTPPDQFTGVDITGTLPNGLNLALAICANPAAFGFTPEVVQSLMVDVQSGNIQVRR